MPSSLAARLAFLALLVVASDANETSSSSAGGARRVSFPLRASPGAAGVVTLSWTPPLTPRVTPRGFLDADTSTATLGSDPASALPPGLALFPKAATEASTGRAYDIQMGPCLVDDPSSAPNDAPLAPLPCAPDAFLYRAAVRGTSARVEGLTPGLPYAFRVVTRDAPSAADDADAISSVAVAASDEDRTDDGSVSGGGSVSAPPTARERFAAMDVERAPRLRFCGATRGAFPDGTLLLDGADVVVKDTAACCLACADTPGCNAWAHCPDDTPGADEGADEGADPSACAKLGVADQCWLMYVPADEVDGDAYFYPTWPGEEMKKRTAEDRDEGEDDDGDESPASSSTSSSSSSTSTIPSPWIGGVLRASEAEDTRPPAPTGLTLSDASGARVSSLGDVSSDDGGPCASWDPPPPLVSRVVASSATESYVVETFASEKISDGKGNDDGAVRAYAAEGRGTTTERSAALPTRACRCDGWTVAIPDDEDDDDDDEDTEYVVRVRVWAENVAGRSKPAEMSFEATRRQLRRLFDNSDASESESKSQSSESSESSESSSSSTSASASSSGTCPDLRRPAPATPPLDASASRVSRSEGGGVLVRWRPPAFDLPDDPDESATSPTESDPALDPRGLGYQVTWSSWDPKDAPAVTGPRDAVVLADADPIARLAAPPCGAGEEKTRENGGRCFLAEYATSLRLEGLAENRGYVVAVRAVAPNGPGPLTAPLVVAPPESENGDQDGVSSSPPSSSSSSPPSSPPLSSGSSAPLPPAPALNPSPTTLYEAYRVGAVYDQIAQQQQQQQRPSSSSADVGALADETTTTTEEFVDGGIGPYGGLGAFGDPYGFGYPFGLGALGLGGYGFRDRFDYPYGGGGGGGGNGTGTNVQIGATVVNVNVALNQSSPGSEPRRFPPPPIASPPPTSVAMGTNANAAEGNAAPRGATVRVDDDETFAAAAATATAREEDDDGGDGDDRTAAVRVHDGNDVVVPAEPRVIPLPSDGSGREEDGSSRGERDGSSSSSARGARGNGGGRRAGPSSGREGAEDEADAAARAKAKAKAEAKANARRDAAVRSSGGRTSSASTRRSASSSSSSSSRASSRREGR